MKTTNTTFKKFFGGLFAVVLGLLSIQSVHAQISNGDFGTGDFTDWNTLGVPTVITSNPTPPSGTTYEAFVQSTSGDNGLTISDSAASIDSALGVTLPGAYSPTNGQAIYQTFTVNDTETVSFEYSFQTYDYAPLDSAGYVLDGVYTQLDAPPAYGTSGPNTAPGFNFGTDFATDSFTVGAGSHTLGFVAYNTYDNLYSTGLAVTDITAVTDLIATPKPSTWALMLGGLGLLAFWRYRTRPSLV